MALENHSPVVRVRELSESDVGGLPSYLKSQIGSVEVRAAHLVSLSKNANTILGKLNNYLMEKRQDYVTEVELRDTFNLGSKAKAILLALIQLKRMRSERRGEETVFLVC